MKSKWQANKIGLVDFWYYDVEEFYFSEGRMLLRGANGSGKSVTMQSFIPLLLDGNMRPERLDPFGSRARRMENYLLEENDERDERTGYLYMEFKRAASDAYITIGAGMRARKNKKLETWYFIITDGRRMNIDFNVYKEVGSKIVLTKRELRNRLADGGHVYEFQGEYMEAVNRHIFGFETLEEYKEMVDLLIQLRTPKLSKDFKPSIINEILSSSLQMLSEDDLRPMSEAIENMDGLKTNVDNLKSSIDAAVRIGRVFDRYNTAVLMEKAQAFRGQCDKYEQLSNAADKQEAYLRELKQKCTDAEEAMAVNKQEEKVLQEELESLNASDVSLLKKKEIELQDELKVQTEAWQQKQAQLEAKEISWHELQDKEKQEQDKSQKYEKQIYTLLTEMDELTESASFDEHAFMAAELTKELKEAYDFRTHRTLLKQRTEKISQAIDELKKQQRIQEEFDEKQKQLDAEKKQRDKAERELNLYDVQLSGIRSEAIEELYRWQQNNRELKPEKAVMQSLAAALERYDEHSDFGDIREVIRLIKTEQEEEYHEQKRKFTGQEADKLAEIEEAAAELQQWEEKAEAEPEIPEAVSKSRALLREKNIPYIQFYKAIDYSDKFSAERQNCLEEALSSMGVLDALIISADYREAVLQIDKGMCDKYIFSDAEKIKENLGDILEIDNSESDLLFYQQVSNALSAIGYKNRHHTAVYEDGSYRLGALSGTITREYEAKFIGVKAREKYRHAKIAELQQTVAALQAEYDSIHENTMIWSGRIETLNEEFNSFLSGEDLKMACREYSQAYRQVELIKAGVRQIEEKTQEVLNALNSVRANTRALCEAVYLPVSLERCRDAGNDLNEYQDMLRDLEVGHNSYVDSIHRCLDIQERMDEVDTDLDNLRYDIGKLERERRTKESALDSVREQLSLTNYEEIKGRMDYCAQKLSRLPEEYLKLAEFKAADENQQQTVRNDLLRLDAELDVAARRKEYFRRVFVAEWKLGYVEIPGQASGKVSPPEQASASTEQASATEKNVLASASASTEQASAADMSDARNNTPDLKQSSDLTNAHDSLQSANLNNPHNAEELAIAICRYLQDRTGTKNKNDLLGDLQSSYHEHRAQLMEYQLTMENLFTAAEDAENSQSFSAEEQYPDSDVLSGGYSASRIDIAARYAGIKIKFPALMIKLQEDMEEREALLSDKERELYEDILANTISKKIRAKIQSSNMWVGKMNELMGSMKTSSGLTLSLKWRSKSAEHEEQLGTHELVELLKKDSEIMREDEIDRLSRHFRSKIIEARKIIEQGGAERSFHAIMRDILDYRKWFEFQLECRKTGENKRELTDRVFFTFSGGEKAMAMYVPLFSAVVAKYQSAEPDAPKLISLDEAFAGVDEMNIKDMFRLMVEFQFNFIINSQILYGDYETMPQLAIYQLVRPENAKYVSVIRYHWDGSVRTLITENKESALIEGDQNE